MIVKFVWLYKVIAQGEKFVFDVERTYNQAHSAFVDRRSFLWFFFSFIRIVAVLTACFKLPFGSKVIFFVSFLENRFTLNLSSRWH